MLIVYVEVRFFEVAGFIKTFKFDFLMKWPVLLRLFSIMSRRRDYVVESRVYEMVYLGMDRLI